VAQATSSESTFTCKSKSVAVDGMPIALGKQHILQINLFLDEMG